MNKENWGKFLSEIIKSSINNFEMIGDNLRAQCIKYFEQLETNRDEVIKVLKDAGCYDEETKTFCDDVWDELPYILEILERSKEDV